MLRQSDRWSSCVRDSRIVLVETIVKDFILTVQYIQIIAKSSRLLRLGLMSGLLLLLRILLLLRLLWRGNVLFWGRGAREGCRHDFMLSAQRVGHVLGGAICRARRFSSNQQYITLGQTLKGNNVSFGYITGEEKR